VVEHRGRLCWFRVDSDGLLLISKRSQASRGKGRKERVEVHQFPALPFESNSWETLRELQSSFTLSADTLVRSSLPSALFRLSYPPHLLYLPSQVHLNLQQEIADTINRSSSTVSSSVSLLHSFITFLSPFPPSFSLVDA
jgi:hypothetical protein